MHFFSEPVQLNKMGSPLLNESIELRDAFCKTHFSWTERVRQNALLVIATDDCELIENVDQVKDEVGGDESKTGHYLQKNVRPQIAVVQPMHVLSVQRLQILVLESFLFIINHRKGYFFSFILEGFWMKIGQFSIFFLSKLEKFWVLRSRCVHF